MNNQNRKPLIGLIALTAALAMPLALAQETTDSSASAQTQTDPQTQSQTQDATDATSETSATGTTSATGATTQSSQQATGSASAQGNQDWASLDENSDGMISKDESSKNTGLANIFDKADADADGNLTADEYNTYVSKNYGEPQK